MKSFTENADIYDLAVPRATGVERHFKVNLMKSLNENVDIVIWLFLGQLVLNAISKLIMNMLGRNPIIFTECKQGKFLKL